MEYQQKDKPFHLIVVILMVVSFSSVVRSNQGNETNITQTTIAPNTEPLQDACAGGKDVWNICWMSAPPYVYSTNSSNSTEVVGILIEILYEGLKVCSCKTEMKFHRVEKLDDLINCSRSENTDIALPFPTKRAALKDWLFSVVDSPNIYLLLNRKTIESKAKERVLTEFLSVWTIAVLTVLLAFIFGIIVWFLVSIYIYY